MLVDLKGKEYNLNNNSQFLGKFIGINNENNLFYLLGVWLYFQELFVEDEQEYK